MKPALSPLPDAPGASLIENVSGSAGASSWDKLESTPAPDLNPGECHIWSLSLLQPEDRRARLERTLSPEEKQRAGAFLLPAPRQQFVICRGTLRVLLGAYLARAPWECRFALARFGKPGLAEPSSNLRFNVSHSGDQALIAISRDIDVGVDIEAHRPLGDIAGLARMILSGQDLEYWSALPAAQRMPAFYRAWTRKEAVAKAIGCGLALNFPALRVSFIADQPPAILEMDPARGCAPDWTLENVATSDGYSAAIAALTRELTVCQYAL